MKQINKTNITMNKINENEKWCVSCDFNDKCYTCDMWDWSDRDCGSCDSRCDNHDSYSHSDDDDGFGIEKIEIV